MKLQTALEEALPNGTQNMLGLSKALGMDDRIIGIPCALQVRIVPSHPVIERLMPEPVREQGADN